MISTKNKIVSAFVAIAVLSMTSGLTEQALAAPKSSSISVIPTITNLSLDANGALVASGTATAVIHGQTVMAPFSNVPVTITAAPAQPAGTCPVLDLMLGPINLNLLGLVVQTSPICLTITAIQGGGLLGNLLCGLGNALSVPGTTISQALAASANQSALLADLTNILNGALAQLVDAVLRSITQVGMHHTCAILHLDLGPLDLTLLGLNVHLDNCMNQAITVDITAVTGQGNLLGNLLCELLGGNLINLGATLQNILNQILALLNQ